MMTKLLPNERLDDLQIRGYEIIQSPGRFCFGMDAVLLSAFANVKKHEKALDLGTGTGILPILLEAKYPGLHYTGLEIQEESADMARRSVSHNGLEERIDIVTGDIKEAASIFGAASFGVITTNPPYMIGDHGLKNQNTALYIKRKCETIEGQRKVLHGPQAIPASGDHDKDVRIRNRAKTYAAGISAYRQRTEHGADRGYERRKSENAGGAAADRISEGWKLYRRTA